ncbi:MAG TPA: hypothetical protein VE242_07035, partial [Chthoniobacterales bacterium]|nr:hypothetical protein [Chthoniobacterales bacterium]
MNANLGSKDDDPEPFPPVRHHVTQIGLSPLFAFIRVHSRLTLTNFVRVDSRLIFSNVVRFHSRFLRRNRRELGVLARLQTSAQGNRLIDRKSHL